MELKYFIPEFQSVEHERNVKTILNAVGDLGYISGSAAAAGLPDYEFGYSDIDIVLYNPNSIFKVGHRLESAYYTYVKDTQYAYTFKNTNVNKPIQVLTQRHGDFRTVFSAFPFYNQQVAIYLANNTHIQGVMSAEAEHFNPRKLLARNEGYKGSFPALMYAVTKYIRKGFNVADWSEFLIDDCSDESW